MLDLRIGEKMDTFIHGLILTVVGMGLVFLALGIFLASMMTLTRLFPGRETSAGMVTVKATSQPVSSGPSEAELAAISAALAIWLKEPSDLVSDSQLGATLKAGPSPWGVAARGAQRRS
jgi:Na+-transporting methylmalonyl-CoA/oxaloacetate decarboxylase gamma subunit